MSRTERFFGGVVLGYAQQVLFTFAGFWLTPFLLHRIGQHDYGLWLVGLQILTWLTLMDFGIVALLPRETAYALGRAGTVDKATELPGLIAQTARTVLLQWPFVASLAVTGWIVFTSGDTTLRGPIAIVIAAFALGFPLRIFRAVLEGLQDLVCLGRLQIASWAAGVLVSVSLVLAGSHLYALAVGWAVTQLSLALMCFLRLKLSFPGLLPPRLVKSGPKTVYEQFGRGVWVSLAQVAYLMVDGSDLLIIGKSLGASAVVPYFSTEKVISVLTNQPTMLMHAASPGLSAIKSSGDRKQAFLVVMSLTQGMLLLSGGLACIVLAVNQAFVSWWVGPKQFAGTLLTVLVAASMLLRHWNSTAVHAVFCFGHERRLSLIALADGSISVLASVLLVKRLGFIGAPLGSILAVCLTSLPFTLAILVRESGNSGMTVISPLLPWLWRFILMAIGAQLLSLVWTPTSPLGIVSDACVVGACYAMLMFPMILKSTLRIYLPARIVAFWTKMTSFRPHLNLPAV